MKRNRLSSPMSSPTILPTDLIIEILSWLPVKFLVRFTSVSKLWKSLIFDPSFTKLHLQRSPKNTHVLFTLHESINDVDTWVVAPYSLRDLLEHPSSTVSEDEYLRFNNNTYYVVGSTKGLVCLMDDNSQQDGSREIWFQFWNPTLRLSSEKSPTLIVKPNARLSADVHCGFGYDKSSDTFKVVAVFWNSTTQKMDGRVHCMGNNCWRKTLACPDIPTLLGTLIGQFVNSSLNWLALNNLNCHQYKWENVTIKQLVIFSLDLRKETCKYISLPDGFVEVPEDEPTLVVLRGCLCLYYDHMKTHFVLWEMREFGVQESWIRLVNVSYVHLQFNNFAPDDVLPVCLSENGDLLLMANKVKVDVIKYNSSDDKVEYIQLPNNQIWYADEHMQSLVLPRPGPHKGLFF
ncbi:unnamed protein product [Trifolium pratense]|uniref:Uncharacterized protein n=1 Tax=Trifolium pratense TaxID=57577 RepID=A0ACB0LL80_TRIPR|nr:unnamed protein product [Trifolium pratense]